MSDKTTAITLPRTFVIRIYTNDTKLILPFILGSKDAVAGNHKKARGHIQKNK